MRCILGLVLLLATASFSFGETVKVAQVEVFTFLSGGVEIEGKIYLPASYNRSNSPVSIYLIDFTEQHFAIAKDEFEKVIEGVEKIQGLDAVVVTLKEHLDVDAQTSDVQEYYDIYRSMASYVEDNYTSNTSRTFIGRGSEAGLVLATLFVEDPATAMFDNFIATDSPTYFNAYIINLIDGGNFPQGKTDKKLHFSFSTSNNRFSCTSLINAIDQAEYPWLHFGSMEYTFLNHEQAYPFAYSAGLKFVYDNVSTGSEETNSVLPEDYRLSQNYPNPFNPVTTISYDLPQAANVTLTVVDVLGRTLRELAPGAKPAGTYEVTFDATGIPSGVYFYRLEAGDFVETKRMVAVK